MRNKKRIFVELLPIFTLISLFSCGQVSESSIIGSTLSTKESSISSTSSTVSGKSDSKTTSSKQQTTSKTSQNTTLKPASRCGHTTLTTHIIPATCISEGCVKKICSTCGNQYTDETIAKINHDYSYEYASTSQYSRTYSLRKMCIYCGQTENGENLTKTNNKIALNNKENIVNNSYVGMVASTSEGITAYPFLGYEFVNWSNGEKSNTLKNKNDDLIAIFKYKSTELDNIDIILDNNLTIADVKRDNYRGAKILVNNEKETSELTGQFKGRGNGSWVGSNDKSGYTIKLDSKANFAGMSAKAKKWNFIACKDDESMHINYGAYAMARNALPGIEWQTETKFVNFYVNNQYRGVYMLTDAIKVEKGRIDAKCEDSNGDYDFANENPGFLIEYDRYSRSNSSDTPWDPSGDLKPKEDITYIAVNGFYRDFSIKYPDPDDAEEYGGTIKNETFKSGTAKIKKIMTEISNVLSHGTFEQLAELVDINSMLDMYCLHELFKNSDVGWSSFYLYKKPGEKKVRFGPAWDFDLAATYGRDNSTSGKHISTKKLNGDPNTNTNAAYNDIFVKAVELKDKNNKFAFAELLNSRFEENKESIMESIISSFGGNDNKYLSFALNSKKWTKNQYSTTLKQEFEWLFGRTKWMLANDFVR